MHAADACSRKSYVFPTERRSSRPTGTPKTYPLLRSVRHHIGNYHPSASTRSIMTSTLSGATAKYGTLHRIRSTKCGTGEVVVGCYSTVPISPDLSVLRQGARVHGLAGPGGNTHLEAHVARRRFACRGYDAALPIPTTPGLRTCTARTLLSRAHSTGRGDDDCLCMTSCLIGLPALFTAQTYGVRAAVMARHS